MQQNSRKMGLKTVGDGSADGQDGANKMTETKKIATVMTKESD